MDIFTRIFGSRRRFEALIVIAAFYTVLSFAYSFVGFLHYQPGSHYHEYALGKLTLEISGHFLFGVIAALPLLDVGLALLTGSLAVLIDIDHVLSALNYDVSGRPDHSILYVAVSALFIFYAGKRSRLSEVTTTKLAFVAPIAVLAHFSFDVFASSGTIFQALIPFSFQRFYFPDFTWAILEAVALLVSCLALYASSKRRLTVHNDDETIALSRGP